jgi:hypothetical protein
MVPREHKVLQVLPELQVLQVLPEHKDLRVLPEHQAVMDKMQLFTQLNQTLAQSPDISVLVIRI